MFGQAPRAAAASFTVFTNWSSQLVIAVVFPQMQTALGNYSFLPFMGMLVLFWIILFVYFPETKNQSAALISLLFQLPGAWKKPIGLRSAKYLDEIRYKQEGNSEIGNTMGTN